MTGQPTSQSCTEASEVLFPDIVCSIEICIQAVPTVFTEEEALRFTIGTVLMITLRTSLRGMSRVNLDHLDTAFLSLICDEVVKLSKRPSMQPTFSRDILVLFAASNLAILSDVFEVFQNDRTPWVCVLDDTLAEDMITISVETRLPFTQFLEMTFSGFTSFRLQLAPNAEILTVNFFPLAIAKKATLRGYCGSIQSEVYPDDFFGRGNIRLRNLYHNMQPVLPIAINEIGRSYPIPLVLCAKCWHGKGDAHLANYCGQAGGLLLPIKCVGVDVVSGRANLTLRAFHGLELRDLISLLLGFL